MSLVQAKPVDINIILCCRSAGGCLQMILWNSISQSKNGTNIKLINPDLDMYVVLHCFFETSIN